ncbi:MAG: hypothetical protein CM15mV54_570 [Caudoviricetes sp.]|nr:MAG: hypothetical protein CM15mV54_570 [Caudoviricetes sp.]
MMMSLKLDMIIMVMVKLHMMIFDTTNHEDWDPELKRLNPEVDAQLTAEWLAGLENPTMMSRAKALWQQNGAGQNMARYINIRRRHALSEAGMGEEGWLGYNSNVAEGLRQTQLELYLIYLV